MRGLYSTMPIRPANLEHCYMPVSYTHLDVYKRQVLRLTHELGLSVRQVREATGVGKTAVSEYVSRARVIGITWPIPPEITDAELELSLIHI